MDTQAATLLSTLKRPAASSETKLTLLNALKSDIKHYRVPESAQPPLFECLKLAITQSASSNLASSAFSTLGHLIKRLKIQDAAGTSVVQLAPRLMPAILERLGDTREALRSAAMQALTDLHPFLAGDVESLVRDEAIGGANSRAKQSGMQWVLRMHRDEGMAFKGFTQALVARLEDSDGGVRDVAKGTLIELFAEAAQGAKADLRKQMKNFGVRHTIESAVVAAIGGSTAGNGVSGNANANATSSKADAEADMASSTRSLPSRHLTDSTTSEISAHPPPTAPEPPRMDPVYITSKSDLEETFRTTHPYFEGKETEQNWTPRDKSVTKLRRITAGNAPSEYHAIFMSGIKATLEGILKVANSLRTTMSSNGCQLVQELLRTLGPAMDVHVEMLLQTFIKMSAATKHIAAENGRLTADAVFQHCSYKHNMISHIWAAAQDKNAQTRQCATEWLKTVVRRQSGYKSHFESSGGAELAEKCLRKGLDDANPKVKEGSRSTFWLFAKTWSERATAIMGSLDPKSRAALEKDSGNPHAALYASQSGQQASSAANSAMVAGRASGAASRNTLREVMAEQRRAKAAGLLPDRPVSAMAELSPAKSRNQRAPATTTTTANFGASTRAPSSAANAASRAPDSRNISTASTTSTSASGAATTAAPPSAKKVSSLMSGPVRRPRRPEIPRPQTADPYASSKRGLLLRPETPGGEGSTPASSPPKSGIVGAKTVSGDTKGPATGSAVRNRAKTAAGNGKGMGGSPRGSPAKRSPGSAAFGSGGNAGRPGSSGRPGSKGSIVSSASAATAAAAGEDLSSVPEDDLTMVMPRTVSSSNSSSNRGAQAAPLLPRAPLGVHGHAMSVDTGLPTVIQAEEEVDEGGFTMVLPSLSSSQQLQLQRLQELQAQTLRQSQLSRPSGGRASFVGYRSPLKAMFEEARDMVSNMDHALQPEVQQQEQQPARQKSVDRSPERAATPVQQQQQQQQQRAGSPLRNLPVVPVEEVMVYEDPFTADADVISATAAQENERRILGELPLNENSRFLQHSPATSQLSGGSSSAEGSPTANPNGNGNSRREAGIDATSTAEASADVRRNRRLLASGIERVKARSLDAHGFRRLAEVARSSSPEVWDGGKKFDELVSVVLDFLSPSLTAPIAPATAEGDAGSLIRVQAWALIRLLLQLGKGKMAVAGGWHARILAVVLACADLPSGSKTRSAGQVEAGLERTGEEIVKTALASAPASASASASASNPVYERCVDTITTFLSSEGETRSTTSTTLSLTLLCQLLSGPSNSVTTTRASPKPQNTPLALGQEKFLDLAKLSARFLGHSDAGVRKGSVDLGCEIYIALGLGGGGEGEGKQAEFWGAFQGVEEGRLGVLVYYIARREAGR